MGSRGPRPLYWLGSSRDVGKACTPCMRFQKRTRKTARTDIELCRLRLKELIRSRDQE